MTPRRAALERAITEHLADLLAWDLEAGTEPVLTLMDRYGANDVERAINARIRRLRGRS